MSPAPDPSSSTPTPTISPPLPCAVTRDGGASVSLPPYMTANTRNSISITNTKGLLNMPGQNNCFLNSAVQVLWHLDIFRRSFRELNGHACMSESCIFCALKELFAQFQYSQESALPPDALRRALAETFCDQRRFQLGFMDDAAECFENILLRIHFHIANKESEDMCSASHCIPHQKFAMTLVEQTVCYACGATSEPLPFTQMVHYVPSSALCSQAKILRSEKNESNGFGELLKKAGGLGDLRDCPSSCGTVIQIRKTLMNRPEIVSIGLVWDSERPTINHIMDVFSTIGMTLKLQDVFHSVVDSRWASSATHQLVGIVTYYGKHYSTFFFHTKLRVWIYFDDAAVREIGPKWEQVVEKCYRGHFQPLLLLYANPYGSSISTSTAPHDVTVVTHKKSFCDGKDLNNVKPDKVHQNLYLPVENQRRAMTPNPEASFDVNASIQPRRAVTPNGEVPHTLNINPEKDISLTVKRPEIRARSVVQNGNSNHIYNASSYLAYKHELWQNKCAFDGLNKCETRQNVLDKDKCTNNQCWSFLAHSPTSESHSLSDASTIVEKTIDGSIILTANDINPPKHLNSDCNRFSTPATSVDESCVHNDVFHENGSSEKTYISRKTVENVLHLQKLQRQKSINAKHNPICINQRNSNSSLESLENVYFIPDKSVNNFLGLNIPEPINTQRKRDSGNWSGDRNSASSSSSTSLDNPYFYAAGNKRPYSSGRVRSSSVPDSTTSTDLGYDSFSLSSSDSYPSIIAFAPGKSDPRLGQILENQQTAFIPHPSQAQQSVHDFKNDDTNIYGFRDECEKLCIEADIFLAKSVERENIGDLPMAALLSDNAAAKARSAMDVPYSNPHSLSLAKLKHTTCIIRSCNLHKKLKDAVAVGLQKRSQILKLPAVEHYQEFKNKENCFKLNNPEQKVQVNIKDLHRSNTYHKHNENHEKTEKAIEIYATLPKKSLRRKSGLLAFVESFTSDDGANDKNSKHKSNESGDEKLKNEVSVTNENSKLQSNQWKNNSDPLNSKCCSSKKKSFVFSKSQNKDSDLSDSNSSEQFQKSSLYRTYSGPPSYGKVTITGDATSENQSVSSPSPKKQHKIRRKLMGGFMRRKNRSLPDLREGQDQTNGLSRSFDDCAIQMSPAMNIAEKHLRESTPISLNVTNVPIPNKEQADTFENNNTATANVSDTSIKHTQSFNVSRAQNCNNRTNTPPSYKPPTPITTEFEVHYKRSTLFNKDNYSKSLVPVNLLKPHDFSSNLGQSNLTRISTSPIGKNSNKNPNDSDSTSTGPSASADISLKQNVTALKYANNQELPKGSAIWLKELQIKQEEIIKKKRLLEEQVKLLSINNQNSALTETDEQKKHENCRRAQLPKPFLLNCGEEKNSITCSANESVSKGSSTLPQLPNRDNDLPNSVKYLASKFEKITRPSTDATDYSTLTSEKFFCMGSSTNDKQIITSDSKWSIAEIRHECAEKMRAHNSFLQQDREKENNAKCPSLWPTSSIVQNTYLTDGQLTNMLCIGENYSVFRNTNAKTLNSNELSLTQDARRPDKPPDYETAIQRLELIRGDRNFLKHFDISYMSSLDPSGFDIDKKKRGPKKSVTFSDKVVLVACAGDGDNDFLTNPLLERVYKQQFLQSPLDSSEKEKSQNANFSCENKILCATSELLKRPDTSQSPCNLCHSKLVLFPNVYCSDCAFYMSRFQK